MATDLSIYEGSDKTWGVTITDSDGDAVDITGYTFLFVVKRNIGDSDDDAIIKKEITSHNDPTSGKTQITLVPEDTSGYKGNFLYDYQLKDTLSKRRVVLKKASFLIEQRVGDDFS